MTAKKTCSGTNEKGATVVEYSLTIALIAFALIIGLASMGTAIQGNFEVASDCVDGDCPQAGSGGPQLPGG